jgi:cytochrome c biogenesis protein CcdA
MAGPRELTDPPRERLRQLEHIRDGEARETQLFSRALNAFVESQSADDEPRQASVRAAMEGHREEILASVESDRATFRAAFVEHAEALQRLKEAWRATLPVISIVIVLATVISLLSAFLAIEPGSSQWIVVALGIAIVLLLLVLVPTNMLSILAVSLRYESTNRGINRHFSHYLLTRRALRVAIDDLYAAEELFVDALLQIGFAEEGRRLRNINSRASARQDAEPATRSTGLGTTAGHLPVIDSTFLVDGYRGGGEINTDARAHLRKSIRDLAGASIGVSGPRGVGKTTLIRSVFDIERTERGFFCAEIAAPVRYDPREFVLALFAQLCEQTVGARLVSTAPLPRQILRVRFTLGFSLVLIAAGLATYLLTGDISLRTEQAVGLGLVATGILLGVSCAPALRRSAPVAFGLSPTTLKIRSSDPDDVVEDLLAGIRFQLTYSSGYGGKLTAPVGEISTSASYTAVARQESFPEILARFSAFIECLVKRYGKVLIGIDELDKLTVKDAVRFLDDVKGLFGIEGCFFVLAVSEDALAQFERRGVPFRDSFDSAFDEIVRVEPFSLPRSVELLERRSEGIPGELSAMCHALAGGLPRELIRYGRRVAALSVREPTVVAALEDVVIDDLAEKQRGMRIALRAHAHEGTTELFELWLDELTSVNGDTSQLAAVCTRAPCGPAGESWRGQIVNMVAFAYLAATLRELAVLSGTPGTDLEKYAPELARARIMLGESPGAAWKICNAVREANGLTLAERPWGSPDRPA